MSDTIINFYVPLLDLKPFLKYLEYNGHDIDTIDNKTLALEWVTYCKMKETQGEA